MEQVEQFLTWLNVYGKDAKTVTIAKSALSPQLRRVIGIHGDNRHTTFMGVHIKVRPDFEAEL